MKITQEHVSFSAFALRSVGLHSGRYVPTIDIGPRKDHFFIPCGYVLRIVHFTDLEMTCI